MPAKRQAEFFDKYLKEMRGKTDQVFTLTFLFQWVLGILLCIFSAPSTWIGQQQLVNVHMVIALFGGGLLSAIPIAVISKFPDRTFTRYVVAVSQLLWSALLIYLSGGKVEAHFHIFVSLALLAVYHDWRVLLLASVLSVADITIRGALFPLSVFGESEVSSTRWLVHMGWLVFADAILIYSFKINDARIWENARMMAELEIANDTIEKKVVLRTHELWQANEQNLQEIEKRKSSEKTLQDRSQDLEKLMIRQRALMNNIPDLIWMKDTESHYLAVNEAFSRIANIPCDEVIGKSDAEVWCNELANAYVADDREVIRTGLQKKLIEVFETPNEGLIWLETIKTPVLDEAGQCIGTVGVARDITEQKKGQLALESAHTEMLKINNDLEREMAHNAKIQKQLVQAEKMEAVGILTGGIAHDFNNILWMILGNTELLLESTPKETPEYEMQEDIYKAAERAKGLVQQLLDFSRKSESTKQNLSLCPLIRETVKLLRATIPTSIELQTSLLADNDLVLGDPSKIHQVLMNLITNAYQAIGNAPGVISISLNSTQISSAELEAFQGLTQPGYYHLLEVRDTGCGMTEDILANIFDPFFTTKDVGAGTGLGLSTVHGVVAEMDGAIQVSSEPGHGTVFRIYLPAQQLLQDANTASENLSAMHEDYPQNNKSVLVVDDEPMIRDMIQRMFEKLGYQAMSAENGVEGLIKFITHKESIDLVFTDQTMPELTGMEMAHRIFEIRPELPVILATGNSLAINEEDLHHTGVKCLINKPIQFRTLQELVQRVLDASNDLPEGTEG